jgi:hypothetical protein
VRAGEGSRTPDLLFTRQVLYQLSYSGSCGPGIPQNTTVRPQANPAGLGESWASLRGRLATRLPASCESQAPAPWRPVPAATGAPLGRSSGGLYHVPRALQLPLPAVVQVRVMVPFSFLSLYTFPVPWPWTRLRTLPVRLSTRLRLPSRRRSAWARFSAVRPARHLLSCRVRWRRPGSSSAAFRPESWPPSHWPCRSG